MEAKGGSSTLSVYIPKRKGQQKLTERLQRIAQERDRSVNYLVIQAISEYLERAEMQMKS